MQTTDRIVDSFSREPPYREKTPSSYARCYWSALLLSYQRALLLVALRCYWSRCYWSGSMRMLAYMRVHALRAVSCALS